MELTYDYRHCDFSDIEDALRVFIKGKVDSIHISNINASAFSDHFDVELRDMNGWDGDQWGDFEFEGAQIHLFGCMWHGYIIIDRDSNEE